MWIDPLLGNTHRSVRTAKRVPGKQTVGMKVAATHLYGPSVETWYRWSALNSKGEEPMLWRAAIARGGLAGCLILVAGWLGLRAVDHRAGSVWFAGGSRKSLVGASERVASQTTMQSSAIIRYSILRTGD